MHVPQLEALLREAGRLPPLIDALINRLRPLQLSHSSPRTELVTGSPLPAAPLTRRLDCPDDAGGAWLRADPVGLVPDLAAVWFETDADFKAGAWSEGLAELLAEEGLDFHLAQQGRGYIRLQAVPDCRFQPPWRLAGTSLEHCQPEGPDARFWRRLLNETQVFLQQQRQSAENPDSIPGSLWFWGGGELPDPGAIEARVNRIIADDAELLALADWLGLTGRPFDDSVEAGGGSLVEWPSRFERSADENLEELESFLRVAWRRLRRGRLRELEVAGMETLRRFTVRDAWRVWR